MLTTQHDRLTGEIDKLVERHGSGRGALIPILQDVQRRSHALATSPCKSLRPVGHSSGRGLQRCDLLRLSERKIPWPGSSSGSAAP